MALEMERSRWAGGGGLAGTLTGSDNGHDGERREKQSPIGE